MKKLNFTKTILLGVAICLTANGVFAQPTTPTWAKTWNSSSTKIDAGYAITTDASGNVYVTGAENTSNPVTTDRSIQTIKYNPSGTLVWNTRTNVVSSTGNCDVEAGYAIAVDASGNVWVAAVTYTTSASEYDDLTLIRYNSSGVVQTNYPKHYVDLDNCGTGGGVPRGICLAVYDASNVYVGGSSFDGTNWKLIVLKDNVGNSGWGWSGTPYTKSGSSAGYGKEHCATDLKATSSAVYVTGWIQNTSQGRDWWTAQLNASTGSQTWGAQYDNSASTLSDVPNALAVDGAGNVYVAGYRTTSSNGTDGVIIKYNSSGSLIWTTPYNNSSYNKDEVFTDVAIGVKCTSYDIVYAGGYMVKNTGASADADYLLAAYDANAGGLSTCWSTNPVTYDGAASAPEASGTDYGYAIEYASITNRIYISGMSDELVGSTKTINITTRGYNATNGSNVWSASYDYGSDAILADDGMFWKYGLKTVYKSCYGIDFVYVEGNSVVQNESNDFITLEYGATGACDGPVLDGGRYAQLSESNSVEYGLYPNPFSTNAVLTLAAETKINNAVLSVYDITGRVVSAINNINSGDIVIDRGNMPQGLYFYKLSDSAGIIAYGKFIIAD
ncbi:MAG: T9SS type A sorting domain-containing protein [Bacteroidetes bacterium]|nr:T9SS type A sorting domain-containing protein [Bacteroidota bacterium]